MGYSRVVGLGWGGVGWDRVGLGWSGVGLGWFGVEWGGVGWGGVGWCRSNGQSTLNKVITSLSVHLPCLHVLSIWQMHKSLVA